MNENILLIRFKSIGDVVLTLPAVNRLRDRFPAAKISFLTSRENGPMLRGFRAVDEILTLDRAALSRGNPRVIAGELVPLLRRLRAGRFSLVADFQGYGETEWLAWWSGAPARLGIVYKPGRGGLYTQTSTRNFSRHPAGWNLDLLASLGGMAGALCNDYHLPADALTAAREFFTAHQLDWNKPTLFIQPFTSNRPKNWPLAHFVELARVWHDRGVQIIFGGGPADRPHLEPARAAGLVVAAGVPLLVSAGLMQLSTLVLGADTGLLHLAVAQGRRVIMLIQANNPGTYHPFQHPEWTVTPPPGRTVADIAPDRVMAAVTQALTEPPRSASC
jgi:ADP-heptose:LPS heptosyltransferase